MGIYGTELTEDSEALSSSGFCPNSITTLDFQCK